MLSFAQENVEYQRTAKRFLSTSRLLAILKKYGNLHFLGSYPANLMMSGDVDILVAKNKPYSSKETLHIFGELYQSTNFRSYFIKGDWNDPRKGNEFPKGQYIGLKQKLKGEVWKFDIWFIPKEELKRLKKKDISNIALSQKQREVILLFKKYRKEEKLKISGQEIYDLVLKKGITRIREFKKEISLMKSKKK